MHGTNGAPSAQVINFAPRPENRPLVILAERDPIVAHHAEHALILNDHSPLIITCPLEVEAILGRRRVDCLVVGLSFGLSGEMELIRRARLISPSTPIIAIRHKEGMTDVVSAMKAGASDVLQFPIAGADLVAAIGEARDRAGAKTEKWLERRGVAIGLSSLLTVGEREIIQLYSEGIEGKDVAIELGISPKALTQHRLELLAKLGAGNMCEAIRIVFSR